MQQAQEALETPRVREALGRSFLLVPGVGAQGGDIASLTGFCEPESGLGILVSASRSVTFPWRFSEEAVASNFREAIRRAGEALADALRAVGP